VPVILVSGLLLVRDRRVLMVRSRGRSVPYLPGGKREAGETAVEAVVREAREETALRLTPDDVVAFGTVTELAHDQVPGTVVAMDLFLVRSDADQPGGAVYGQDPVASAEVDAVEWVTSADADRCPPAGVETLRLLVAAGLVD
jgi:8-oxo-dGTP pyrophosphatase MutT (NUDIX family)